MQDLYRFKRWDGDRAAEINNHPNTDEIPEDLRARILSEFAVKASCRHCHESHFYYSLHTVNEVDCRNPDCNHEIVLP